MKGGNSQAILLARRARSEGQPGRSPPLSSPTFHIPRAKSRMPRFFLPREPRLQCLGLRAFLFEDFPLRLKPVIKGALADALFVDLTGSHRDPRVEIF